MDTPQPTYALVPPVLDSFGGAHFTAGDDAPDGSSAAWVGDPSSVPLPAQDDHQHPTDGERAELDQAIFAALLTP